VSRLRVATWNLNSFLARQSRLESWLAEVCPDVICLQETKLADEALPKDDFARLGYDVAHSGPGRWNGVAIASRIGLDEVIRGFVFEPESAAEGRLISARCGPIKVASVYVPNGRSLDSDQYLYKLRFLEDLRRHLEEWAKPTDELVLCGDFNVAPDDRDVWDPGAFEGATHVSPPERKALADLEDWGLIDVMRALYPDPFIYTWWDYRAGSFHKHQGMRIDLVLATRPLAERLVWAVIDRNARKGERPSDHAPVLADFAA
jgi:exodeoxyribonuclease-3